MGDDASGFFNFLIRYGQALGEGDLDVVSACWETLAFVLADEGARAVMEASEIRDFFKAATDWYHAQGLVAVSPELRRYERVSPRIVWLDVAWTSFDRDGAARGGERSRYLIGEGEDGQWRIRVAVSAEGDAGSAAS